MNPLIIIIIALATYVGGLFSMYGIQHGLPPKTNIQNISQVQTVDNKNTSIQESSQGQFTIVTTKSNFNFNWNGKTNISTYRDSKTNITHKTQINNTDMPFQKALRPHF